MALIKCPECGKDISDKAKVCIHCGYPLNDIINKKIDSIECPICKSRKRNGKACAICGYTFPKEAYLRKAEEKPDKSNINPVLGKFYYAAPVVTGDVMLTCTNCDRLTTVKKADVRSQGNGYVILGSTFYCDKCNAYATAGTKIIQKKEETGELIRDGENLYINNQAARELIRRNSFSQPSCPKCGSTAITTGARGVSGFWGLIGASKTVNRCGNCGHTWTPKG